MWSSYDRGNYMSRFLGKILSKTLTGKSLDDYVNEGLFNFCVSNGLTNTNLKKFLIDTSPTHQSYYLRTHIGTVTHEGQEQGLIVTYDEGCGYTWGHLFPSNFSLKREESVKEYKRNGVTSTFHNHFLFDTCNNDFSNLIDSNGD